MFFPERMKSISATDRVLEIGPGADPHPRANVLLEKHFSNEEEARSQRGDKSLSAIDPRTIFFEGGRLPFPDASFDYVICSHVIEHVDDPNALVEELMRVARKGYIEYPSPLYEYLYSIPVHKNFVHASEGKIAWLPKSETRLADFQPLQSIFLKSLERGYSFLVDQLKDTFIEGFEWEGKLDCQKAKNLNEIFPSADFPNFSDNAWNRSHVMIHQDELKRLQAATDLLAVVGNRLERLQGSSWMRLRRRLDVISKYVRFDR